MIIPESFQISSNLRLNKELVDFFKFYSFTDFHIKPINPAGHTNEEFLEIVKQNIHEKSTHLEESIKQMDGFHYLSEHLNNSLIYGAANYIVDFKIINKESYNRDILYDFSLFPLNNVSAINDVSYRTFIYNYFMDIFWSTDTLVKLHEKGNKAGAYREFFKIIESSNADPVIKDILYASFLDELLTKDKTGFMMLYPDIININTPEIMLFTLTSVLPVV